MIAQQRLADYKKFIEERWSPVVAIQSNDKAEEFCMEKTGLSLSKLFNSHGVVTKLNHGLGGTLPQAR
jgi:hypothetical protein